MCRRLSLRSERGARGGLQWIFDFSQERERSAGGERGGGGEVTLCLKGSSDNTTQDMSVDPQVIDNTGNPLTWASRVHGQAAAVAGWEAVFQACQDEQWCIEEAGTWTARGF